MRTKEALNAVRMMQNYQPSLSMPMGVISTTIKLKIQFAAVPRTTPLVRMERELIYVGYNQGTPCHPIPKKA
jgi:hypothetical protein